jgi:hypothetical protein
MIERLEIKIKQTVFNDCGISIPVTSTGISS